MRISIIQSCYIPWKGFFDLIGQCDEYVIFDSVQYVRRHWHNRNKLKTQNGAEWLTIPVRTKGRFDAPIDRIEIEGSWTDKHWRAIEIAYRRAPYFKDVGAFLHDLYERAAGETTLTAINEIFLIEIASYLGLKTRITRDTSYPKVGNKTERLLAIAKAAGATSYLSGPSAKAYLSERSFSDAGISVEWMEYSGYQPYPQLFGEFEHAVSIVDLLFNAGPDAPRFMKVGGRDFVSG